MKIISRLNRWYCYLFYMDYLWQSKPDIRWGNPAISATCALAYLFLLNCISLLVSLQITFFGKTFLDSLIKDKLHFLILIILPVIAFHHFLFMRQNKYKKIVRYYEKHPINKKHGAIIHWIYVIGSLTVFIGLLFLGIFLGKHNLIPLLNLFNE